MSKPKGPVIGGDRSCDPLTGSESPLWAMAETIMTTWGATVIHEMALK